MAANQVDDEFDLLLNDEVSDEMLLAAQVLENIFNA